MAASQKEVQQKAVAGANVKIPFSVTLGAGAVAGISEILCMYPLDVVKTRFQLTSGAAEYTGMIDCLKKIVKNEGFSKLYRGITAPILMEAPKRATKFAANDEWGATAGATETFVVVPFELVKIRLQDKKSMSLYTGPGDCLKKIIAKEGPLALYNGLEATMWRHVSWNAGYFGVIHKIRTAMPKAKSKGGELWNNFVAGALGGTFGTMLNTPFDVVKSRIQNSIRKPGVIPKYNWTIPSISIVAKEEGVKALYKGFTPKVLRLGPGGGILLVVYDQIVTFYKKTMNLI